MKKGMVVLVILFSITTLLAVGCKLNNNGAEQKVPTVAAGRMVVDMAGREVSIPAQISKVYADSPVGTVFLYTIAPELLAGWSYHMAGDEASFILPQYRNLPVLGGWSAGMDKANVEEIIKIKPDLVLLVKAVNPATREVAEEIQRLTHVPVFVVDASISKMEEAYRVTGKVLEREARTTQLADYCRATVTEVTEKKKMLAGRKPVTVYYAEGRKGLETEPRGSWHAEIIEYVGGENVAGVEIGAGGQFGRSPVSMEQILLWNPEVVLIGYFRDSESSSFPQITGDKGWQNVQAVAQRRVYEIPNYPFNWFDRPPSVNRLIGIKWVAHLLYPDVYPDDFPAEVQRFYQLFYHYSLSPEELTGLLQRTQ